MKTFKKTLTAFLIKELGLILSLFGKLMVYLAVFSSLEIIELNSQVQVSHEVLIIGGLGVYLLSFMTSKLYSFFQMRHEKSTRH